MTFVLRATIFGLGIGLLPEAFARTEFETGRASNGLVTIGAPRLISGGVRLRL